MYRGSVFFHWRETSMLTQKMIPLRHTFWMQTRFSLLCWEDKTGESGWWQDDRLTEHSNKHWHYTLYLVWISRKISPSVSSIVRVSEVSVRVFVSLFLYLSLSFFLLVYTSSISCYLPTFIFLPISLKLIILTWASHPWTKSRGCVWGRCTGRPLGRFTLPRRTTWPAVHTLGR